MLVLQHVVYRIVTASEKSLLSGWKGLSLAQSLEKKGIRARASCFKLRTCVLGAPRKGTVSGAIVASNTLVCAFHNKKSYLH